MDNEQNLPIIDGDNGSESTLDRQKRLTGELTELTAQNAPQADRDAKADEINRNVADLIDEGEVAPEDAWALSAGHNPYIDPEFDQRDF